MKVVELRRGTYGLVYIREATGPHIYPRRGAAKTIPSAATDAQLKNFQREIEVWIGIPNHRNVLPITSRILFADVHNLDGVRIRLPLVYMPYCDDSLASWVGAVSGRELDAYMAFAGMCNGLSWLYDNGIQEHGDLKPENILLKNLTTNLVEPTKNEWLVQHPWEACVADLGWANAWKDLGYSNRAWRPYLAPERLEGSVTPRKSDVFSVGVIAAELFQGFHPAGKPTRTINNWNDDRWRRWCLNGQRYLSGVPNSHVVAIIQACLNADPDKRPDPAEITNTFLLATKQDFGTDLRSFFEHENSRYKELAKQSESRNRYWVSLELGKLSDSARDREIERLSRCLSSPPSPPMADSAARWLLLWEPLGRLLLARRAEGDLERVASLAVEASDLLCQVHGLGLDIRLDWYGFAPSDEEPYEVIGLLLNEAIAQATKAEGEDSRDVRTILDKSVPFYQYAEKRSRERIDKILLADIPPAAGPVQGE